MAHNLLILMSDEHTRKVLGCYGNAFAHTPHLDRLAARGTLFTNAYTPCPICVPARASFAHGQYGHVTHHWNNATPYIGVESSWGHVLQQNRRSVGSIGKLHYRNQEDATRFDFQLLPMHLVDGVGDVLGCVRNPLPKRWKTRALAEQLGGGETSYTRYDREITDAAVDFLQARAEQPESDRPWTAFVSLVCPHFPLVAPQSHFNRFAHSGLMPSKSRDEPEHDWLAALRECFVYDNFTSERTRVALAAYYGLVSFMDENMGRILNTLEETGLVRSTVVLYLSDHGDNIGERGLWGKSTLFEESVGIPTIVAGPGVPSARVCHTSVNLTDVFPTVLDIAEIEYNDGITRPGRSLIQIANEADDPQRPVFSEYHGAGACSGAFMLRKGRWKYLHYVGLAPQLYDLKDDPHEQHDLGREARHASIRAMMERELRAICNPEAVQASATAALDALIERHGGREAVLARGGFGATPAPGEQPKFVTEP